MTKIPTSTSTPARRFRPPWTVKHIEGGFCVCDASGVALAFVYARDDLARSSMGFDWLTTDEARRIATGIAKLPDLLGKGQGEQQDVESDQDEKQ